MDDDIVPNIVDSPLLKTLSLIFNKITPYNLWMTPTMKDSGLNLFKNRYNRETRTLQKSPFRNIIQILIKAAAQYPTHFSL